VAVRLSSFERYYEEEAWTWELQALTRARPVAGDAGLGARIMETITRTLCRPHDSAKVLADVADMRGRMERERNAKSVWDMKLAPGGFVDIEFIAQGLQLVSAAKAPGVLRANTGEAIEQLARAGALDEALRERLLSAWRKLTELQQTLRIAVGGEFNPETAPSSLKARVIAMLAAADLGSAEQVLRATQAQIRADFVALIGPLGDGGQPLKR